MQGRRIRDGVYWVGAVDWDRRLFDSLIPLPDGTSYNAYLVQGSEKTALIDTVDPAYSDVLLARLEALGAGRIDYVVSNHAEQDHSGSLPLVLAKHPAARLIATPKGQGMLMDHLSLPADRFQPVEDGAVLSLGGRTLEFIHAPWVHWPETMFTYLREDRILFSCDLFGSHLATSDLYADEGRGLEPAKRYYAEIMMPFRSLIARHIEKIKNHEIDTIAASHGPVYGRAQWILDAYRSWIEEEPRNVVVLPYVSMHGSTQTMVRYLAESLTERGVGVEIFPLADADTGKLAMALVDAATVVFASPGVLHGLHPKVVYAAYLANLLRPKAKFASLIGSFGWGVKMAEELAGLTSNLKVEFLDPVVIKGHPRDADLAALGRLADAIADRHRGLPSGPK